MKKLIYVALLFVGVSTAVAQTQPKWKLVWEDNFNSGKLDESKWNVITRGESAWKRYMSAEKDLISFENGNVVLTGRINKDNASDTSKYVTGGIDTKNKYTLTYGRIEIRAKLGSAQGAWPAFWMVPNERQALPGGEIDIMEHLNFDDFVYQTAHSHYTIKLGLKDTPQHYGTAKIKMGEYNVYGLEWYEDRVVWMINGEATFVYPRIKTDKEGQWQYDVPFFIMLDQQLGGPGTWPGEINDADLPVKMWIDWIKVYKQ